MRMRNFPRRKNPIRKIAAILMLAFFLFPESVILAQTKEISAANITKTDWKTSEKPIFDFTQKEQSFWNSIGDFASNPLNGSPIEVVLVMPLSQEEIKLAEDQDYLRGGFFNRNKIEIKPEILKKSGRYKLKIKEKEGSQEWIFNQDFTWGVLAINTNKSIYLPGENALLSIGVLDETGNMVCDAKVKLLIKNPEKETEELSTENGKIKVNPECQMKAFTLIPDYEAAYQVGGAGEYAMTLTAETKNGTYVISDGFAVKNKLAFDVERLTATRIYPLEKYPVVFDIKINQDFKGRIVEEVPKDFEVDELDIQNSGIQNSFEIRNSKFEILENENNKQLIWEVEAKKGEEFSIGYQYDAPDVSPEFYLLGPLQFIEKNIFSRSKIVFKEARQWQIASDAVTSGGFIFYGDTTNVGKLKITPFTNPSTYGTEINTNIGSAVNIMHVAGKTSPTREETMFGYVSANPTTQGRLDIVTCSAGCDVAGDYTSRWSHSYVSATQDCDSAPTLGTCYQPFDLGYEALSGRALVVYAGDGADAGTVTDTDTVYYAFWNGNAWSPNSTPGTPGVSNALDMPGTGGTPEWIRVIPVGDNLANTRSNRAMVMISDSDDDLYAFYWDGSSFDSGTEIFTTLGNCGNGRCFDGNWQGNNTFVITYTNSGVSEVRYQKYTVDSGWGGDAQAYTTAATPMFLQSAADPTSSRIITGNFTTGNDTRSAVWRADDTNDGWTTCGSGGCPDTVAEGYGGPQMSVAFERFNGEGLHILNDAATNAAQGNKYMTYTPTATWSSLNITGITPTDDQQSTRAIQSPNSDDIMIIAADVDCDVDAIMWNGSGFGTVGSNFELLLSSSNNSCANGTPIPGMATTGGYDFAWTLYSPWGHNWRWTDDETNATPGSWLSNENIAPTTVQPDADTIRLRYGFVNRGVTSQVLTAEGRKKLQWTTDSPDSVTATWTDVDVDDGSGIWRYNNCAAGTDDSAIPSAQLTAPSGGSNQVGDFIEGTGNITITHNTGPAVALENDYCIESNGATALTTYYFRAFDNEQLTPVFREQTNYPATPCGGGNAACSYPSLTTVMPTITVSGYCFTDETEGTACTDDGGDQFKVAVNGVPDSGVDTAVDGSGFWSFTMNKPASGATMVFYRDGETDDAKEAVTVTKYDGSGNVDLVKMYQSQIVIGTDTGSANSAQTVSITDMGTAGNGFEWSDDEDVFYRVSSGNLIIDNNDSAYKSLYVIGSNIYAPGGNTTMLNFKFEGTITAETYTFNVSGNFTNSGTFTAGSSVVNFNSGSTGKTIDSGGTGTGKDFYDVTFNNGSGGWTLQTSDLKITHNLTITNVNDWTLASGRTLEVDGTYSIADAQTGKTTWTGSTFYLNGTTQTVGTKTQSEETYATLQIGANTDVRMWNSSASAHTVDATGSLYSMDYDNNNGDLYIWGDYHTLTNDYWSYATDFDGNPLTGSERQVDVRIDPSANVTVDSGDTLAAVGAASANRTNVSRQGSSNGYGIIVDGGMINFQYADFEYLDGNKGLDIRTGSTVTSLDYCKFNNLVGTAATDDAFITVASTVIGSATKTLTGVQFDDIGGGAEFNVNRTGSDDSGYWTFSSSTGDFDGEDYDGDDGVNEADPGMLRWVSIDTPGHRSNFEGTINFEGAIDFN